MWSLNSGRLGISLWEIFSEHSTSKHQKMWILIIIDFRRIRVSNSRVCTLYTEHGQKSRCDIYGYDESGSFLVCCHPFHYTVSWSIKILNAGRAVVIKYLSYSESKPNIKFHVNVWLVRRIAPKIQNIFTHRTNHAFYILSSLRKY